MKLLKTPAILLRYYDYGESSRIFIFFTRDLGKVTLAAKGARKSKKRHFTTIDLLSYLNITFKESTRSSLETLSGINMIEPFFHLRSEIDLLSTALYFADLLSEFFKERESNERMFDDLLSFLTRFEGGSFTLSDIAVFQLRVLGYAGFSPNLITCISCDKPLESSKKARFTFSNSKGGFICEKCGSNSSKGKASLGTIKLLKLSREMDILKLNRIRFTKSALSESISILSDFIDYNLNKRLKSFDYLKMVIANK